MGESPFLEVPHTDWIGSNRSAFAIWDRFPVSEGHALVVPRRLISSWWEASTDERHDMLALIDEVKRAIDRRFSPDGYNVGFNDGAAAGQTVPHLHIHIIPRFRSDVPDPRGGVRHVIPGKGNYLAPAADAVDGVELFDNSTSPVVKELARLLRDPRFDRADFGVSFILRSGLDLLQPHLEDALDRGVRLRLLTTDYLNLTQADALARLLDLAESSGRLECRVFQDEGRSFHPKGYLFWSSVDGTAWTVVGSSNLSRSGISEGVEWNAGFVGGKRFRAAFERLWNDHRSHLLNHSWLADYRSRHAYPLGTSVAAETEAREAPLPPIATPTSIQREALDALEATRQAGYAAGLVVMATGLGKTWLAAFDSARPSYRRVLFIAHREELLTQARDVFRRVQPDADLGLYHGAEKNPAARVVFASIQTLSRHLGQFSPAEFDYIVVDEFHHAAAASYRRAIDHFQPSFLLGLTATPDRMDGADLLALCENNLVYQCDLVEAIKRAELVPFNYWGIRDVVDFAPIPWRNGRFDPEALTRAVETAERAEQSFAEWKKRGGKRTLAFCASITHADFMVDHFAKSGVRAVAVHSGDSSAPRRESILRLSEGDVDIVFSVDVFNEGLDVPAVDTVLMLRPTESPIVFLQQLGRGLRLEEGKDHLRVIDFVGNHRSFLLKPRVLLSLGGRKTPSNARVADALKHGEFDLPPGCSVNFDLAAIDLLAEMAKAKGWSALEEYCRSFFEEHGSRPSAAQVHRAGLNPRSAAKNHGHWFGFLDYLGLLSPAERGVVQRHGEVLRQLETEAITKSYKLVTLRALLHDGALRTGAPISQVSRTAHRIVITDPRLLEDHTTQDMPNPAAVDDETWEQHWRRWPVAALSGELAQRTAPFRLVDERLVPSFEVEDSDGEVFDALVAELVDYRLTRYLEGKGVERSAQSIRCKLNHSDGRPFILLDRSTGADLPFGEDIAFLANGEEYRGDFRKIALNVARRPGEPGNALHALLRGWFGPSAGLPGTRQHVVFEMVEGSWILRPDRQVAEDVGSSVVPLFANYRIACGAFEEPEPASYEAGLVELWGAVEGVDPSRNFVAFARGESMSGGPHPIHHGDPLLFEWARHKGVPDLLGATVLVEYREGASAAQALKVLARVDGQYELRSTNPEIPPIRADSGMRVVAQLVRVLSQEEINPLARHIGMRFKRAQIPALYGLEYNDGIWRTGHVSIPGGAVLFVTLDKGANFGQGAEYVDHFESPDRFVWSSQASTSPDGKKGREILEALDHGTRLHLWLRRRKTEVVFEYRGLVVPVSHDGSEPMSVRFRLLTPAPEWVDR